ncbi:MAG: hypothetical protein SPJ17_02825 [Anaeroplasma sp.]|uniref:hypothetical protein n=1 Tax=Anaeroplasma sp. TaxID=1872523 RepID=UPI002A919567|nr:hypothetical protein [Anaeroplasma sp.]MDY5982622.1 hypothetical protein [Anaeroplasma sp.]
MDQSRYEQVPKKEGKAAKAFKNFGKYLKTVGLSIIESFKYNRMKLPAFMLGIGGILIGLFLSVHAATIKQLTYTYSYVTTESGELVKYTAMLPGMPYDYTGIVIFILMLLGILNIFIALAFNSKQNKGSVVSATIITLVMIGLTIAYVYAVTYFKTYHDTGIEVNGTLYRLEIAGGGYESNFLSNYMGSMIVLFIADGLSILACVLGFIHYNRAYEKGDDR